MSTVTTGARVVFRINGAKVAFANAITYSLSHQLQPVDVLDQPEPAEYAETGYTVSFTSTQFRVPGQSPRGLGLVPRLRELLTQPELTAELVDRITGQTIFLIERVKANQEDFNTDARSLAQLTISFLGIKLSDEAGA